MAVLRLFLPEPKCQKSIYVTGTDTLLSEMDQVLPFAKRLEAKIPGWKDGRIAGTLSENCEYLLVYHLGKSARVAWDFEIDFVSFGIESIDFCQKKAVIKSETQGYIALFKIVQQKWEVNWQIACPVCEEITCYTVNNDRGLQESNLLFTLKKY
jgi:hypothetical protein